LQITETRISDKGRYDCVIKNGAGRKLTASAMLHVPDDIKAPKFLERPPLHLNISAGENFTLFCNVDGNPIPSVQWLRNDTYLTENHKLQ
jgi:hypothetical protein